ncbi:ImuA family protein [Ensifer sp. MJa1]|uniref:ImuA family protein n=1 Tax=Ensifer sp. MJa1 TaxID=2919888 RepID=UPI00300B5D74
MADKAVQRETVLSLRETIARIENRRLPGVVRAAKAADPGGFRPREDDEPGRRALALGIAELDDLLDGGLPLEGLTEIRNAETRDAGAAAGFTAALSVLCQKARLEKGEPVAPVLWISQSMASNEAGMPYGLGLKAYGLDVRGLVFSLPRTVKDALWIAEAALSVPSFCAVILEIRGNPAALALSESRRLHVRSRAGHVPLLLLRQSGHEEASSAFFRFLVEPAPARERPLPDGSMLRGSIGHPVFHVIAEKSRAPAPLGFQLEWNPHDRRLYPVEPLPAAAAADPEPAHSVARLSASSGRSGRPQALGELVAFPRAS